MNGKVMNENRVLFAAGCAIFAAAVLTLSASASAALAASAADPDAAMMKNFKANCQSCHGPDGKGRTTAGKKVGTKDWTDAATFGERSNDELVKLVRDGITKDGKEKMKPFAKKLDDAQIGDLVNYALTFKGGSKGAAPKIETAPK